MASYLRRRSRAVAVLASTLLVVAAPFAGAHGSAETAGLYESNVTAVKPEGTPIRATVLGGDDELEVVNESNKELVFFGYAKERQPYARIGPRGVFVNTNTTAYWLNQERFGDVKVPATAGKGAPRWKQLAGPDEEPVFRFHDHRIHWMSPAAPPHVDEKHPVKQKVYEWKVPFAYAGSDGEIVGELFYVGGERSFPLAVVVQGIGIVVFMAVLLVIYIRKRRQTGGLVGVPPVGARTAGAPPPQSADESDPPA